MFSQKARQTKTMITGHTKKGAFTMSCTYHADRSAVNTCARCGSWLCDGCSVTISGEVICKACIAKEFRGIGGGEHGAGAHAGHGHGDGYGHGGVPHGMDPRAAYTAPPHMAHMPYATGRPRVNGFLLLCFSSLPGANYMYMGLIRRGLCVMAAFFASIYMTGMFGGMPFAFLIPILVITSMFDSFRIRRLVNAGEKVNDNIDDVRRFIREHRAVLSAAAVAVVVIHLMQSIGNMFSGIFMFNFGARLLPWIFIGIGCYFLFRRRKSDAGEEEVYIDKRQQ